MSAAASKKLCASLGVTHEDVVKYRQSHRATLNEARSTLVGQALANKVLIGREHEAIYTLIEHIFPSRPRLSSHEASQNNRSS